MNHHLKVDPLGFGFDKLCHVCCQFDLIGSCRSDPSGIPIGQTLQLD